MWAKDSVGALEQAHSSHQDTLAYRTTAWKSNHYWTVSSNTFVFYFNYFLFCFRLFFFFKLSWKFNFIIRFDVFLNSINSNILFNFAKKRTIRMIIHHKDVISTTQSLLQLQHLQKKLLYTVNPLLFERRWDCRIRGVFKLQGWKVNERSVQTRKRQNI